MSTAALAQPSDEQVLRDAIKSKTGLIEAHCAKGSTGEQHWDESDRTWYWDRGVVIKRKANIAGAPNAVVTVRGLARYNVTAGRYSFKKFLYTDSRYEGIPAPTAAQLVAYVKANLKAVFQSREHLITAVDAIELNPGGAWTWHTANSFTVPFRMTYKQLASHTDIETRRVLVDIRFYRNDLNSPIRDLLATEKKRESLGRQTYTEAQVKTMKTLRDGT
jgi:hypothetical protein